MAISLYCLRRTFGLICDWHTFAIGCSPSARTYEPYPSQQNLLSLCSRGTSRKSYWLSCKQLEVVRQYLTFIGLHKKNSLLTLADAVKLWMLFEIYAIKIECVVKAHARNYKLDRSQTHKRQLKQHERVFVNEY